jgi:hypothetical protein
MFLLAMMLGSIIPAFIMVRRSAEIAIRENCATNEAQAYLEQLRIALLNTAVDSFPFSPPAGTATEGVPTYALSLVRRFANGTTGTENFYVSAGSPPDLTTLAPAQPIPGASTKELAIPLTEVNSGGTITATNTMNFRLSFWLENLSVPADATYGQTRGITVVYSWDYRDGSKVSTYRRSLRTMLSTAKTY